MFAALTGAVSALSFDSAGCRLVQLALEKADRSRASALAMELRGQVRTAIGSPHANYVIQKVIEAIPMKDAEFVVAELSGIGADVARHRYGCRVVCRIAEQHACGGCSEALICEVLASTPRLCRHRFGHHVINSILEHGTSNHRSLIAAALRTDLLHNAMNRNASYVVQKAFTYCCNDDQSEMVRQLVCSSDSLLALCKNQFGCFILKDLLQHSRTHSRTVVACIQSASEEVKRHRHGKQLMEVVAELPKAEPAVLA